MLPSRSDRVVRIATGKQFGKEVILSMPVIFEGTSIPKVIWQGHRQTLAALTPESDGAMEFTGNPRQGKIP